MGTPFKFDSARHRARRGMTLAISLVWLALFTAVGLIVWALRGAL